MKELLCAVACVTAGMGTWGGSPPRVAGRGEGDADTGHRAKDAGGVLGVG